MANTFSSLFVHFVFSTKNRKKLIYPEVESRIWSYMGGIVRKHDGSAIQIGGVDDHIHALVRSPPKQAPSKIVKFLKGESSHWIRNEIPKMGNFGWQDGYSAFSVSQSIVPKVIKYIQNQRIKHEGLSFEEEYKELLELHEIEVFDDRYLFGWKAHS